VGDLKTGDGEGRLIVESMPGLAWSASQDGRLEDVNPRFLLFRLDARQRK